MSMERVVEVWECKWLGLAEPKHLLALLLCTVVFAVSGRASSRAADTDYVHQDITTSQTLSLSIAAVLHGAGGLRPFVLCITSIK